MKSLGVAAAVVIAATIGIAAPAHAASFARTLTFTGDLGESWSATAADGATNWVTPDGSFAAPGRGDRLIFPAGLGQLHSRNDITGLSVRRLDLSAPVDLVGQPLTISGGGVK